MPPIIIGKQDLLKTIFIECNLVELRWERRRRKKSESSYIIQDNA